MIIGFITGFSASLLSWQINLIALQQGLKSGRRRETLLVGLGALAADLVFLCLAFTGMIRLLEIPHFWMFAKGFGAATLVFAALKVFRHDFRKDSPAALPLTHKHMMRSFAVGGIVVISNPAIFLLWVGVLGFILTHFPDPQPHHFLGLFFSGFIAGGLVWYALLSFVVLPGMRLLSGQSLGWISKITAVVLLITAVVLLFEKF